jgi:glycosyltransferase involved in cell wall biosynthesis
LIEAFAKVLLRRPDWHLVMAGPDQVGWQTQLNQRAEEVGAASRITWTGMLHGELKWGALRAAEIFVLPSHQENFGIAVAEALAVGVPTLISDKVNIWREVLAGHAGLVAEDTLEGTCRLLQSYLEMPGEQKLVMRECARVCFAEHFEIGKAAENLEEVLANVSTFNAKPGDRCHELFQTQS